MTPAEERELLERFRPWLARTARDMLADADTRHVPDLMQEGWVAIWREIQASGKSDPPWLQAAARNRMRNVIRDTLAAKRDERRSVLVDDVTLVWAGEAAVRDLEWAYHHGEIAAAVDALHPTQREYVYLRFWRGWDAPLLNAHFRVANTSYLWQRARPKLAAALAHLAPANA